MSGPQRSLHLAPVLFFTLASAAATWGIYGLLHIPFDTLVLGLILFLGTLTFLLHLWQERAMITDPKGFVSRFMLGLLGKMLLSLLLVVALLVLLPRERSIPMALTFASLYLAFLAFSTLRLTMLSRTPPDKERFTNDLSQRDQTVK